MFTLPARRSTMSVRRSTVGVLVAAFSLIGMAGGLAGPAHAQSEIDRATSQSGPHEVQENGGGGMWGLFGLFGLLGLVGLVPRSPRRVLADPLMSYPAAHQPFVPRQAEAPTSSRGVDRGMDLPPDIPDVAAGIGVDVAADVPVEVAGNLAVRGEQLDPLEYPEPTPRGGWSRRNRPERGIGERRGTASESADIRLPQTPLPSTQDYDYGYPEDSDTHGYTGTLDISAAAPRWPRRHYR